MAKPDGLIFAFSSAFREMNSPEFVAHTARCAAWRAERSGRATPKLTAKLTAKPAGKGGG